MNHRFYFATCQVTAEKAVKDEWKKLFPSFNFSFSRPGFVTFKDLDPENSKFKLDQRPGIFARLVGESIAQQKTDENHASDAIKELIPQIPDGALVHVFERDLFFPGDEPEGEVRGSRIKPILEQLKRERKFRVNEEAQEKETVYDLIWLDPGHWFLGKHVHSRDFDSAPGSIPALKLPEESPSRAHLKIIEAIHRFKVNPKEASLALEVGCSPGGASYALLSLGIDVLGVDPKTVDDVLIKHPRFNLVQKMAKNVTAHDLEGVNPDWILMDINLNPKQALEELTHITNLLKKQWGNKLKLKRGFLTLKMTDWDLLEDVPQFLAQVERMGFKKSFPLQLVSNRQEFLVYALT